MSFLFFVCVFFSQQSSSLDGAGDGWVGIEERTEGSWEVLAWKQEAHV